VTPNGTIVDVGALVKVVWVSLVAGVGVTTAFSLIVFGLSRGNEARRGHKRPAPAFYALALAGVLVCAWAIWRGYEFVVTKA